MSGTVKKFKEFVNESENKDTKYKQLYDDVEFLKHMFDDYKEVYEFFADVENHIYGKVNFDDLGFGAHHTPLYRDIANYLVKNDFVINIDELERTYKTLYFEHNINRFVKLFEWAKSKGKKNSRFYYYKTIKKKRWNDKYTPEEKIKYIRDSFNSSNLSRKYEISMDYYADFINVDLIEK